MKNFFAFVFASSIYCAVTFCFSPLASAQVTEVPSPNANGDFTTATLQGYSEKYNTRKWLVVDPDSTYLSCRTTPNGRIKSRLMPGAVITAVFPNNGKDDAVVFERGSYWLRVSGTDLFTVGKPGICYVRANIKYIVPINEDSRMVGACDR